MKQNEECGASEVTVGSDSEILTSGTTRRDLLRAATAVVATGALVANAAERADARPMKKAGGVPVPVADTKKMMSGPYPKAATVAKGRTIGETDRINVAFVGTGGMGGSHVRNFAKDHANRNIRIVGICDVNQGRRDGNKKRAIEAGAADDSCLCTKDYREILADKNVDAVMIATPEHWHGQIAVHAMEAGKHVYIQKPMTRYLDEAFYVHDAAIRTGRVVQVGSQGSTNMIYHAAGQAIRDGKIGKVVMGQGSYTRNSQNGEWNYGIDGNMSPENLDWDLWLGSAPMRPWDASAPGANDGEARDRMDSKARYNRYRKFSDYSAGILGDLMPHKLHPFLIASGNPEYPVRVSAVGTQLSKDREVADTVQVLAEFPSGWSMLFVGSTVNEQGMQDMFRGHKATIYFGNAVELKPERWASEEIEATTIPVVGPTWESHENHEMNWLDAIRGKKVDGKVVKANCDIDLATKVQTIVSLAEMSIRLNKTMLFNEKTRKVTAG
ncbi:MAG: Gfo/Idh/MocA family oxidoreductase [Akkermansiaceae bacterium]|nr:Gfo/Idh/MocA family oxidoreductase [Armatimonadota bacterium]